MADPQQKSIQCPPGKGYTLAWTCRADQNVKIQFKRNGSDQFTNSPSSSAPSPMAVVITITVQRNGTDVDFDGSDPTASLVNGKWAFTSTVGRPSPGTSVYTLLSDVKDASDDWVETVVVAGNLLVGYADYDALTDSQKQPLSDWAASGTGASPRAKDSQLRLADAKDVATLMHNGGSAVADAFADELTKCPQIISQMSRLDSWFISPNFNGSPASGDVKSTTQCQLVRVLGLLISSAVNGSDGAGIILNNTVEHFMGGLPLELGDGTSGHEALAQFADGKITMAVGGLLNISASGVGDREECLKKLCHEVNHACRSTVASNGDLGWMMDEFYAYMLELLAVGQTITLAQVTETWGILRAAPYNLGSTIDSEDGKQFANSLKFTDHDTYQTLDMGSIPNPDSSQPGWNLTNALA